MSSLHSNTRGIVSAHIYACTHTSVYIHRSGARAEWGLVMGKREGGRGGGGVRWWLIPEGPAQSNSTPIPTQTPTLPHPWRDHPPLAPLLIEHRAPRPLWVPGDCSRATVWCGLWLRSLLGLKITHQRWGGKHRKRGREGKVWGQGCTHGHMVFDVKVCFNAAWLHCFLATRDRPDKSLVSVQQENNDLMCSNTRMC